MRLEMKSNTQRFRMPSGTIPAGIWAEVRQLRTHTKPNEDTCDIDRCYHHMLRSGELVNAIVLMMTCLAATISMLGETGVVRLLRETLSSGLLTAAWYEEYLAKPTQLRS